jgi:hypothetical protein
MANHFHLLSEDFGMKRLLFVVAGLCVVGVLLGAMLPEGIKPAGSIYTDDARHSASEIVSVYYKNSEGAVCPVVASGIAIDEHDTDVEKAEKYVAAINDADGKTNVEAALVMVGQTKTNEVKVIALGANKGIKRIHVTNNTRQVDDEIVINPKWPKAGDSYEDYIAYVYLSGVTSSVDDDGNASTIHVGTEEYLAEYSSPGEVAASAVASAIVTELVANGVDAEVVANTVIKITMTDDDVGLIAGLSDTGIGFACSVGFYE